MCPPFSPASLSSLAVALGVQDADLTKEPQRDDQSELKVGSFRQGLFLVLANAFFFLFLSYMLSYFGSLHPSPNLDTLCPTSGLGSGRVALSPAALAATRLLCWLCCPELAEKLGVAWGRGPGQAGLCPYGPHPISLRPRCIGGHCFLSIGLLLPPLHLPFPN